MIDQIEKLLKGELSATASEVLWDKIEKDAELRQTYDALVISIAASEMQIADDSRSFLADLVEEEEAKLGEKPKLRFIYLTAIAASILILVLSVLTVNISHSDGAIASNYGIATPNFRSSDNEEMSNLEEAIKAFQLDDLETAQRLLSNISDDEEGRDHRDWLQVLVYLNTVGSSDPDFKLKVGEILQDESHTFFGQAKKLEEELGLFWRKFVF